jgi:Zn-dependent alcohol dehydrogenase
MLSSGQVNVRPMLNGEVPLEKTEDALMQMHRSEVIKVAVRPNRGD